MSRDHADSELVEILRRTKELYGAWYPVLKDQDGKVIDGFHRLEADPGWPAVTVQLRDRAHLHAVRLLSNWARRDMAPDEKARHLTAIAEETGWKAKEISENLGIPYPTVARYLPERFKDGAKARAGRLSGEERRKPASGARADGIEETPEESLKALYGRFGPDAGRNLGVSYLVARYGMGRWDAERRVKEFLDAGGERSRGRPPDGEGIGEPKPAGKPRVEEVDGGVFTCRRCGRSLSIVHVEPGGGHRVEEAGM